MKKQEESSKKVPTQTATGNYSLKSEIKDSMKQQQSHMSEPFMSRSSTVSTAEHVHNIEFQCFHCSCYYNDLFLEYSS